jgi:anti-anti-sigma factor
VRDFGNWRPPRREHRGRGLTLMQTLVDSVEPDVGDERTEVRLHHRLGGPPAPRRASPLVDPAARVAVHIADAVPVVRLEGAIDLDTAARVRAELATAAPNAALGLVLDLSRTTALDSSGLQVLLQVARRLTRRQQQLRLAVPETPPIRRILEFVRFPGLTANVEQAAADIRAELKDRPAPN